MQIAIPLFDDLTALDAIGPSAPDVLGVPGGVGVRRELDGPIVAPEASSVQIP